MNTRFRKKPVEIEAFQMTKARRWDNSEWPNWLNKAWQLDPQEGSLWCEDGGEQLFLGTLEGVHIVSWDDWIIRGIKGELYPCKPEIFEATYDEKLGQAADNYETLLSSHTELIEDYQKMVAIVTPLKAMLESDDLMFAFKDVVEDQGWHQEWIDMCDALRVT